MSVRVKFLLFLSSAVAAGLLVSSVWNLRTRLAIFFALVSGAILGKLFSEWKEELKAAAVVVPDRADERRREEERAELRDGALLEVMMSGMREGVLVLDSEMRVVTSNRAAREIFGPAGGAPEGRRLSALTRNPAIHSAFTAALGENERRETKIEMQGPGGPIYDLRVVPLRLDAPRELARGDGRLLRHHAARTPGARAAGVPLQRLARAAHAADGHHRLRRDARRRRDRRP